MLLQNAVAATTFPAASSKSSLGSALKFPHIPGVAGRVFKHVLMYVYGDLHKRVAICYPSLLMATRDVVHHFYPLQLKHDVIFLHNGISMFANLSFFRTQLLPDR